MKHPYSEIIGEYLKDSSKPLYFIPKGFDHWVKFNDNKLNLDPEIQYFYGENPPILNDNSDLVRQTLEQNPNKLLICRVNNFSYGEQLTRESNLTNTHFVLINEIDGNHFKDTSGSTHKYAILESII